MEESSMSINPMDLMRTQEASQIKHIETQRTQQTQGQASQNFQNIIRQEQYKPTQAAKSDNKEYRYDAKEKGNNEYSGFGGKKKNKNQKEDNKTAKPAKSGGIDILI
jgi:hypothetical protein